MAKTAKKEPRFKTEYDGSLVIDNEVVGTLGTDAMTFEERKALTARVAYLLNKYGA